MSAKEHRHRPSHENKSCQTRSSTAVAPAEAQVPSCKHRADHHHRKQQNSEKHQTHPFAEGRLIRLHAAGTGPGTNQLEVNGLAPVGRSLDPHGDIGEFGERSRPGRTRFTINGRDPSRLRGLPLCGIEARGREQRRPIRRRRNACRLLNLRRNCDEVSKATERIEFDQRHPGDIERGVVRP